MIVKYKNKEIELSDLNFIIEKCNELAENEELEKRHFKFNCDIQEFNHFLIAFNKELKDSLENLEKHKLDPDFPLFINPIATKEGNIKFSEIYLNGIGYVNLKTHKKWKQIIK